MKKIILLCCCLAALQSLAQTKAQFRADFNYFWQTLNDNYCYFEKKQIDWAKLKPVFDARIDTVSTRDGFVSILEQLFYELYDHHCSLRTNTASSRRLVPTGADIWAEYQGGTPMVVEVRKGFGAEKVGI